MITEHEPKTKLAAKPCADCAVVFDGELLDDDGICLWCELIRGGEDPAFIKAEREAEEWLKATGLRLDDEWGEQEQIRQIEASLRKCKTCTEEFMPTVNTRRDGRCWDCQNRRLGVDRLGKPIKGAVVEKSAEGLRRALSRLEVDLRYNTRANRAEMQHMANGWHPFNDRIVAKLRGSARGVLRLPWPTVTSRQVV